VQVETPIVLTRKVKVAGEVVAHCRKCGLDLNHVVVAMVASQPKRVLCLTCKTEHAYHRPQEDRGARGAAAAPRAPRAAGTSRSARAEAEAEALSSREKAWRDRIAGQPASAFAQYSPRGSFHPDQLLRHPRFGDGFVARVIDPGKIEVVFSDGPRTLAQGLATAGG
jgi:hypothetical protein